MQLVAVAENIWCLEQPLRVPLFGNLGSRMTVIRLQDNALMLISPVKFSKVVKRELKELGEVKYLIAPNLHHHLHLAHARSAFPQARVYGPSSLQKKRKDIPFSETLLPGKSFPWNDEIEMVFFPGRGSIDEFVFFHRLSRTLIVTDLIFNIQRGESLLSHFALKMNRGIGLGMTRIGKYIFKDRLVLKQNLKTILAWKPEHLVVAHGDVVHHETTRRIEAAFEWLSKRNA